MSVHCGQMLTFRHEYSEFVENFGKNAKSIVLQYGETSIDSRSYTSSQFSVNRVTQLRTILIICGTWGDAPLINQGIADGQLSRMDLVSPQSSWNNPSKDLLIAFQGVNDAFDNTVWKYGELCGVELLISVLQYDVELQNTNPLDLDKYLDGYMKTCVTKKSAKYNLYYAEKIRMWDVREGMVIEDEEEGVNDKKEEGVNDKNEIVVGDNDDAKQSDKIEVEGSSDEDDIQSGVDYYNDCQDIYLKHWKWAKSENLLKKYDLGEDVGECMPLIMRRKQMRFVFGPWKSFGEDAEPTNEGLLKDLKERYPEWEPLRNEKGVDVALIIPEIDCHPIVLNTFLHYLEIGKIPKYIPCFLPWKRLCNAVKYNKSVFMRFVVWCIYKYFFKM